MAKAPGPNDAHLSAQGTLEPGLGKDEPDSAEKDRVRANSAAALQRMKDEINAQTEGLTERERELEKRQHELDVKELELKAREDRIARAEQAKTSSKSTEKRSPDQVGALSSAEEKGKLPPKDRRNESDSPDVTKL